ncbi:MAG: hypothetical protein O3A06_13570 [Proteobacteria bacterium]|nr:hypothetical protein [Pseudomonadota bacterium]
MATKKRRKSNDKQTAYHEAGHAVASLELGVNFGVVSIIRGADGTAGRVSVEGDDGYFPLPGTDPHSLKSKAGYQRWAEEQAVIDYAGHAAVVVLLGIGSMSETSAEGFGAGPDFLKARNRLDRDRERVKKAKARAVEIITARRDDVRKVADDLRKRGKISSQRVDFLLTDSPLLADCE